MCIDKLSKLGFTEKEAQVYLMLFRMGPSLVSALAKRVAIKRVTVYAILDSLLARGLVNVVDTVQGRRYLPLDPSSLLESLEEEKRDLEKKLKLAEECVKELGPSLGGRSSSLEGVHFLEGTLLFHENAVGFFSYHKKTELVLVQDPTLIHSIRQAFSESYCSKISVGASISKRSPVKG